MTFGPRFKTGEGVSHTAVGRGASWGKGPKWEWILKVQKQQEAGVLGFNEKWGNGWEQRECHYIFYNKISYYKGCILWGFKSVAITIFKMCSAL